MDPEVTSAAETPAAEPTLSEHEAQYSPESRQDRHAPAVDASTGADGVGLSSESETATAGDRDPSTGQFKGRHRAKSQQASAGDVPRIQELTRKLREAESERDRLRAAPQPQPARQQAPQPQRPQQPPITLPHGFPPEPKPEDFPDDVLKYTATHARWAARAEITLDAIARQQQQATFARQQADLKRGQAFATRIDEAKQKYADFEAVALQAASRIPPGSTIDHYVLEHKAGPHLLYHFQKHAAELDRVLALSPLEQVDELSLLAQRLTAPSSRSQAVSTGSAAAPLVSTVAKPPNPVRTGPMKSGDEPPSDEGSILDHERYYHKSRR